jgi:hypothetical protein
MGATDWNIHVRAGEAAETVPLHKNQKYHIKCNKSIWKIMSRILNEN